MENYALDDRTACNCKILALYSVTFFFFFFFFFLFFLFFFSSADSKVDWDLLNLLRNEVDFTFETQQISK